MSDGYSVRVAGPAQRALGKLPPRVAEPLVAFIFGSLATAPKTRGKPLRGGLAGYWGARRGDYRIIYRIDDGELIVYIVDVGHRAHIYRPRG